MRNKDLGDIAGEDQGKEDIEYTSLAAIFTEINQPLQNWVQIFIVDFFTASVVIGALDNSCKSHLKGSPGIPSSISAYRGNSSTIFLCSLFSLSAPL